MNKVWVRKIIFTAVLEGKLGWNPGLYSLSKHEVFHHIQIYNLQLCSPETLRLGSFLLGVISGTPKLNALC